MCMFNYTTSPSQSYVSSLQSSTDQQVVQTVFFPYVLLHSQNGLLSLCAVTLSKRSSFTMCCYTLKTVFFSYVLLHSQNGVHVLQRLADNYIGSKGAIAFANLMRNGKILHTLDLSGNTCFICKFDFKNNIFE